MCEGIFLDAGYGFGNLNRLQTTARLKSRLANDSNTVGNGAAASSGNQPVGRGLDQRMAVISGIIDWIAFLHTDVFKQLVSIEHLVPDGCHASGYSDVLKVMATIKCTGSYRLEARGKSDMFKSLAKYKFNTT